MKAQPSNEALIAAFAQRDVPKAAVPVGGNAQLDTIQALSGLMLAMLDETLAIDKTGKKKACPDMMRARQLARRSMEQASLYSLQAILLQAQSVGRPFTITQNSNHGRPL